MRKYETPKADFISLNFDDIITTSVGIDLPFVGYEEMTEKENALLKNANFEMGCASNDRLESTFSISEKVE